MTVIQKHESPWAPFWLTEPITVAPLSANNIESHEEETMMLVKFIEERIPINWLYKDIIWKLIEVSGIDIMGYRPRAQQNA